MSRLDYYDHDRKLIQEPNETINQCHSFIRARITRNNNKNVTSNPKNDKVLIIVNS